MQRVQRIEENMQLRSDRQTDTGSARPSSPLLPPSTLALPAYTVEELESAEAAIEDESVAAGSESSWSAWGGKGLKEVAANVMTAIMGVAVQRLYSRHGHKEKNWFISHKLCKVATDAICEKTGVDVAKAQGFIIKWLPGSVDRSGGRKRRFAEAFLPDTAASLATAVNPCASAPSTVSHAAPSTVSHAAPPPKIPPPTWPPPPRIPPHAWPSLPPKVPPRAPHSLARV
ncbi:uncharacterized protein LOC144126769 [Amblyomma americanum]